MTDPGTFGSNYDVITAAVADLDTDDRAFLRLYVLTYILDDVDPGTFRRAVESGLARIEPDSDSDVVATTTGIRLAG